MIIFIFSLSQHFPTYFGLKWSHNGIFKFIKFFCYFSWIFSNASGRNETKHKFVFSLFFGIFQPIFAWKRSHNCIFWIFLQFLLIFLLRVGLERSGKIIFIFLISQSIPTYYGLKWSHNGIFKFSEFFFYFFGVYYYVSCRNGTER